MPVVFVHSSEARIHGHADSHGQKEGVFDLLIIFETQAFGFHIKAFAWIGACEKSTVVRYVANDVHASIQELQGRNNDVSRWLLKSRKRAGSHKRQKRRKLHQANMAF